MVVMVTMMFRGNFNRVMVLDGLMTIISVRFVVVPRYVVCRGCDGICYWYNYDRHNITTMVDRMNSMEFGRYD